MMNANTTVVAIVAGAAIGLGLGILFAPEKGEVTRQKIKDKAKNSADCLGDTFDENVSKMKGKVDEMIMDLEKRLEELRKYMNANEQSKQTTQEEAAEG